MIICGNIYLDEIRNTFLLKCVLCEKKSKAYTEFTKHIKQKHKTLEPDETQKGKRLTMPEPIQVSVKVEDDMDSEEEKPLIQIKQEMEMEVLEGFNIEINYDQVHDSEPFFDPIQALEQNESLDLPEVYDESDDAGKDKDDDYAPHDLDDDTEEDEDYDDDGDGDGDGDDGSELDNEETPQFTDKFKPTFFRRKRFVPNFLDLYKSQPPLWDVNHQDFENPAVRKECEKVIIKGMEKFNIFLTPVKLNHSIKDVLKYCAYIKHILDTGSDRKVPKFTMGYYQRCDFLQELIVKKNISGNRVLPKTKPLEFKQKESKTDIFIDMLETFPALYDGDHPSYGDVDGRQKALDDFSNDLKIQHDIDFNDDVIANAIEQLRCWYYKAKQTKDKYSKLSKHEIKYYHKCKAFMPAERLRFRYICKMCKKNFNLRHNLQSHLYKVHQIGELPFGCDQCEKKCESNIALQIHLQRVHVGKTYACKFCDLKFAVLSELNKHSSIHTDAKRFTCELCGKSFRLKLSLNYHVTAIHTKIRAFKCDMCPKDFKKKRDLTDHIKSHLNIRDKICETCGKGFTNCHSLIRHRQIHSEIKKFACKLCDAKFHQFVGLNGHMKRTHKIVKKPL